MGFYIFNYMPPPELPGYYYDDEKKKYFKIIKGGLPESNQETKYHHNSIQANKRRSKHGNSVLKGRTKLKKANDDKVLLARERDLLNSITFRLRYRSFGLTDLKIGNSINYYLTTTSLVHDINIESNECETYDKVLKLHHLYHIDDNLVKIYQIVNPRSSQYFQLGIQINTGSIIEVVDHYIQRFCQGVHCLYPDSYVLFDESSISSTLYLNGFLILNTYTVGTQNFFCIRKVTVEGVIEDYTLQLLLFLRKNCHTKSTLAILRPFIDLPYVNFANHYIVQDENELIDNWHLNNPTRVELRDSFTAIHHNVSHSYKFDDNTYTSSVKQSYIDDTQLIIITKIGTIIRISFDKNLQFQKLYLKKFKSIMNFSIDDNFIYIYSSKLIQILSKKLNKQFEIPIPTSKYVYLITSSSFVLLTNDTIYKIRYLNDINQEFNRKYLEVVKICQYFNDNDPNQKHILFNGILIINETVDRFKLIDLKKMENNVTQITLNLSFNVEQYKLRSITKIRDFPITLKLNYIDELEKKSIFVDLKI